MRDAAHRQRDGRQGGLDLERITIGLPPLAPAQVVVPLYGSIWRAVIREGDIGIHLCGKTGQGKTALAVLMQQHFGSQMDDRHLPTSWSTTENVLEELAFVAKDALLVIDEFVPGPLDSTRVLQRKAERIFRAQANRSARQRMRPDGTLRRPHPPRGFVVSTGEDSPLGESLNARVLQLDLPVGSVDFGVLSQCQSEAMQGKYTQVMAAFLKWMAGANLDIGDFVG